MNRKLASGGGPHQIQVALKSLSSIDWRGKTVLDVGCGSGEVTYKVFKFTNAKKIIGIDLDLNRIRQARRLVRGSAVKQIQFIRADITKKLNFPDCFFDGVFSNLAVQQLTAKQLGNTLKEIKRVMRPKAEAVINFNQEKSAMTLAIQRLILKKKKVTKLKSINLKVFKELARIAGFKKIHYLARFDTYYYKNFLGLTRDAKTILVGRWRNLTKKQKKRELQKIKKYFQNQKTNLGYAEAWNMVFAVLTK